MRYSLGVLNAKYNVGGVLCQPFLNLKQLETGAKNEF